MSFEHPFYNSEGSVEKRCVQKRASQDMSYEATRALVEPHLEKLWASNITITTRPVDTVTTSMPLKTVRSGKLQPK